MTYNLYNEETPLQINNFLGTVIKDPMAAVNYISSVIQSSDYILTKTGMKMDDSFPKINYQTLDMAIKLFDQLNLSNYFEEKQKIWINQDSSQVTIRGFSYPVGTESTKIELCTI